MGGPVAMRWLVAAVFLVVALYCLTRVVIGASLRPAPEPGGHGAGRDVDVTHVVVGVGMAAMFSPVPDPVPRPLWTAIFIAAAVWFAARMVRDWPRLRDAAPGGRAWHWHHVIEPLAMAYMVWAMPGPGGMTGMSATAGMRMALPGGVLTVTVTTALWGYFVGFAVWSARQAGRVPVRAALGTDGSPVAGLLLSPRLAVSCHTVMCAGMAYGFLLMM